jgi:hypothetical protein
MIRPWSTNLYATTLASVSLLLACGGDGTPQDTETGSSSSSSSGTTENATTVTTNPPTTGESSSTGPVVTASTGDTTTIGDSSSTSTTGDTSSSTGGSTSTTGTGSSTTGTSTTGTGSSSSTGGPDLCIDGMVDQDETDLDCGGAICQPCEDDLGCLIDSDCVNDLCLNNICSSPTCDDLVLDGAETDIDCGGPDCLPCADNLICIDPSDCESNVCTNGLCVAPSCDDVVQNAAETDVDCGGPDCLGCAEGEACLVNEDCTSGVCTVDICTGASCLDGLKNGAETGIDCGGPACAPCQLMNLIFNEVDYDQVGTDAAEFIEIYNNTGADVSLNGLEVRLVNGAMANLNVYATIKLGNGMLAQGQYLVIGPNGFVVPPNTVFVPFAGLTNQVQNGDPDGMALVNVPNKTVLDVFSYGGAITNANLGAPFGVMTLVEGMALPANKKDNSDPSRSLARIPNGNDKNDAATDWATTVNVTPGAANKP